MKQYDRFDGVINRTQAESSPWWPTPAHPGRGRTQRGAHPARRHRLLPLRLLRLRPRHPQHRPPGRRRAAVHQLPRHPAVLAHPGLAAHRPQPPRASACAPSPTSTAAIPTCAATSPTTPPPWPRSCATRATPPSPWASGTCAAWRTPRPPAPTTSGRASAASTATTASSRARPTSSIPSWSTTTTPSSRRPRPDEGYHLSEDLVDHAIGFIHDTVSIRPDRPFFPYLAFGAMHAPHQAPAAYLEKYRGRFDAGWDVARGQWFARQKAMGLLPPDTELAPRNPGVEPWDTLPENQQRLAARLQEAFAAFLEHTDAQIGRLVDALEALGQLDNTLFILLSDNGASQEGGPFGVLHEMKYFNFLAETPDEAVERHRRHRRAPQPRQLPVGLGPGRQHAVQVVQAEHPRGRGPRPAHRPLAGRHRRRRRAARPVPPRQRHRPHHLRDPGHRGARHLPGLRADPDLRRVHGATPSTRPTQPTTQADPVLRDDGPPGHLRRRVEGGHPPPARRALRRRRAGSSTTWPRTAPSATTWPPTDARQGRRAGRAVVGRGRGARRAAARRPDHRAVLHPLPRPLAPSRRAGTTPTSRPCHPCPGQVAPALGGRGWDMAAVIDRPAGAGGVLYATGTENSGVSLFVQDDRLVLDYNCFGDHHVVESDGPVPPGPSVVGVRFRRTGPERRRPTLVIDGDDLRSAGRPLRHDHDLERGPEHRLRPRLTGQRALLGPLPLRGRPRPAGRDPGPTRRPADRRPGRGRGPGGHGPPVGRRQPPAAVRR